MTEHAHDGPPDRVTPTPPTAELTERLQAYISPAQKDLVLGIAAVEGVPESVAVRALVDLAAGTFHPDRLALLRSFGAAAREARRPPRGGDR